MINSNNVFTLCRRFVRVQVVFSEKKRYLANLIIDALSTEQDQTAALRAIRGCLSECDHDTEAYELLESLLETEGDQSSEDGIDLDESSEESASDDSDADPDFTPSTPPRTRGVKRQLVFDDSPTQTSTVTDEIPVSQKRRKREQDSDDAVSNFDSEVPSTSSCIFDELEKTSPIIKRHTAAKTPAVIMISDDDSAETNAIMEDKSDAENDSNDSFEVSDEEIMNILQHGEVSPVQDSTNGRSSRTDTIIDGYFDDSDYPHDSP
ncbi:unnamed protein product [Oikopleura dioica]|uniref:Uncharacterized protein n=1 Tax=Oikopleura dioica TaxID=34765 RepID=E4XDP8_OIKDI|nr:unnamed protein product [Oikopleura dioica]